MTDLSHWDFAEQFKAKEAAELILGIPPEKNTQLFGALGDEHIYTARITPVLRRMNHSFQSAVNTLSCAADWNETARISLDLFESELSDLNSEVMVAVRERPSDYGLSAFSFEKKARPIFEESYFSRKEISRWLDAIGIQSIYRFNSVKTDRDLPIGVPETSSMWPWGDHHTELLGHLNAAARRYWGENYVSSDATTAPLNATVSKWLQTERKVSKTMADSIASMLRPTGLPTGPRK